MKYLRELARIVTRKKIQKIELFEDKHLKNVNSKYSEFYNGLVNDRFTNDEEAALYFYNSKPTDASYRKLKSRIKKRLFNHLFYLDTNQASYSEYRRAYFTCNKNWTLMKILIVNNARNTFERLGKQTLNQALKYEFTDIIVLCAKDLRYHYSLTGSHKAYEKVCALLKKQFKLLEIELKCEQLVEELMITFARQTKISPHQKEIATLNYDEIKKLEKQNNSYRIKYLRFTMGCLCTQINGDYKELINICDEVEGFHISNPKFYQQEVLATFSLFRVPAYLQLRRYNEGIARAEKDFKYLIVGNNNWFNYLEYYFLMLMHVGDYTKAFETYELAVNHSRFPYMNKIRQEKWKIFEAYLHYIYISEQPEISESLSVDPGKFKLFKFLNEVPIFSKDKSGYNVAILIIQIMMHLQRKEIDLIIDKTEALRVYSQRYLKDPDYFRAHTFIKMLLYAEKRSFDYIKTLKITTPLFEQLKSDQNANISEWEILPFEFLWERVIETIDEIS